MVDERLSDKQLENWIANEPVWGDVAKMARELLALRRQEPRAWVTDSIPWKEDGFALVWLSKTNSRASNHINPLYAAPVAAEGWRPIEATDKEILTRIINECDTLDITRVSELDKGKWNATTIFSNDEALIRVFRKAMLAAVPEVKP